MSDPNDFWPEGPRQPAGTDDGRSFEEEAANFFAEPLQIDWDQTQKKTPPRDTKPPRPQPGQPGQPAGRLHAAPPRLPAHRVRLIRRYALIAAGVWAVAAIFILVLGASALRSAKQSLAAAKGELTFSHLDKASTPGASATAHSMGQAHSLFGSPVVAPLKLLPVFGRQLRAVDGIAAAGKTTINVGIDARNQARGLASRPLTDGKARLRAITDARRIVHDANARLAKIDLGPSKNLIGPLGSTHAKFAAELNRIGEVLQRADSGAAGLETFLKGPSHYAVFAANNSEMRSGSGMYLSAGTLDVSGGTLRLGPMQSIKNLPPAPNDVALEYDFLRLWGPQAPGSDYRFVNMTPRFPTSAALLQRMWAASGAAPIDGVLVLDPTAVVDLIKLVGPVSVNGTKINATNAPRYFLHDQYLNKVPSALRRDLLGDAVQQLFAKLESGGMKPNALGQALGHASTGRHLLAWAPDTTVQRAWNALSMDGTLPDQSVMFSLQNRGGNKLDYFQRISAIAKATISRQGSQIEMNFQVTNAVPNGEPGEIAGENPHAVQPPNTYVGVASINLPANATDVHLEGGQYDLVSGPDGNTQVVSQWVELAQNTTLELRLRFRLPPGYRSLSILPSARYPGILWHLSTQSWYDDSPRFITW